MRAKGTNTGITHRGKRKSNAEMDDEARQAFEMRIAGMRYDQIAIALRVSVGTVASRVQRGGIMAVCPAVEEHRNQQGALLDATLLKLLKDNGDFMSPRVAETITRLAERKAKLFGLDAPIVIESTNILIEGGIDAEVLRLATELGLVAADVPAAEPEPDPLGVDEDSVLSDQ